MGGRDTRDTAAGQGGQHTQRRATAGSPVTPEPGSSKPHSLNTAARKSTEPPKHKTQQMA